MSQPLLSASAIRDAKDLAEEVVEVPEWGGSIRLVQLNAAESIELTKALATLTGADNGMFIMIASCARDSEGARVFPMPADQPEVVAETLALLKTKNMQVLNRLQMVCLRLNKMGGAELAALKKDLSVTASDVTPTN